MSDHDQRSPDELDDLLGAFALDAVDPFERELVERRLIDDPVARAEVDAMRETAAALATLPADHEGAPSDLWDRIAGAIREPVVPSPEQADGAPDAPNVVAFRRSRRFTSVPARVAAPIAAAAAIVIAVLAIQVATRTPSRAGDLAAAYRHAVSSGAATVQLRGSDGGPVAAEIALQPDGTGYLRNDRLAALPAGETYQLWALVNQGGKTRAVSAGVLGREPTAVAFHVAAPPDSFAITMEDAPGVVQPTQAPAVVGQVST
jgi:Anti-sigma-K factor rskA